MIELFLFILFLLSSFMIIILWLRDFFLTVSPNKTSATFKTKASSDTAYSNQLLQKIINIYSHASSCNDCFVNVLSDHRPDITGGQPRWIGKHYFNETFSHEDYPRVLVLLHRPGQLGGRSKNFDHLKYDSLTRSMKDPDSWSQLMELLDADSKHWGKYDAIYKDSMNLNEDFTAFMNIALCAGIASSDWDSINRCFLKYTKSMLELFQPNILLLNGRMVQNFYGAFSNSQEPEHIISKNKIEKMLISKKNASVLTDQIIFRGQPIKVKSYAARSGDVETEAYQLGREIKYLYPS